MGYRYPVRAWYSPLGMMASNPLGYSMAICFLGLLAMYPWRYKWSRFYERQRSSPQNELRNVAIMYYREMEAMYRRQAYWQHPYWQVDDGRHDVVSEGMAENIRSGKTTSEMMYWWAHRRDVERVGKLVSEVRGLKAKIAEKRAK